MRDDAAVNGQDENFVAKLRNVLKNAAEVSQLHGSNLKDTRTTANAEANTRGRRSRSQRACRPKRSTIIATFEPEAVTG